ncbi:MAG: hypothetical protein OES46_19095 [Gammaproteobacteria bacterium]|jgi:hypothetical protein|nr:hypothetical protein [Gammaproteobacteria bacterium]
MTPGLPGTGIGALFYIIGAAWMPLRETARRLLREAEECQRWPLIFRQFGIALGMVIAMTGAFWMLDMAFMVHGAPVPAISAENGTILFRFPFVLGTFFIFIVVLTTVEIFRIITSRPNVR